MDALGFSKIVNNVKMYEGILGPNTVCMDFRDENNENMCGSYLRFGIEGLEILVSSRDGDIIKIIGVDLV